VGDIYSAKTYGARPIGFGRRLGLVVVDFQRGFIDSRFRMGGSPLVGRAVENTARLLQVARARGVPVASCYVAYPNGRGAPHWKVAAVTEDLIEGSEAAQLDPRTGDPSYDYVFPKPGASAFFATPLASFLTTKGVDTVAVAGCVTSGCVRATVVDSFQYGFRTMLIDDCCGDQEPQPHQDTLRDVGRRYADIVTADEIIRYMMANR